MDSNTTVTISAIVLIVGFAITLYNFYASRKKETQDDSVQFAKVNFKLDEICRTTSDIKSDFRAMSNQVEKMKEAQIIQAQEIKALWKNVDKLNGKE